MWILVDALDAARVERGGPALDAVDDIALFEKKFGEIGAILAGNARDERNFSLLSAQ